MFKPILRGVFCHTNLNTFVQTPPSECHSFVRPIPSLAFATSGFSPCCRHSLPWGPPNRHVGGRLSPEGPRGAVIQGSAAWVAWAAQWVLQRPDPHDTKGAPALLQLPRLSSLLTPCSAPCSSQSLDTLRPCRGQPTVPQDSLPQVAQSRLPRLP